MAIRYWVGGTGTWNSTSTANWSASSGGSSGASAPTTADTVIFNSASNTGTGAFTVTIGTGAACTTLTASGLDGAMTLAGTGTLTVAGGLTFPATNLSVTGSFTTTFTATGTITTNGVSFAGNIVFNGSAQTFTLGDAFTTTATVTYTQGNLALAGYTLTCRDFSSNNTNTRQLRFGGGKIVLTGDTRTVWNLATTSFTITGTPNVELSSSASTGTRTIIGGNSTIETNAIDFYILSGSDTIALANNSLYGKLDFTGFSGTFTIGSSNTLFGSLIISSTTTVTSTANTLTLAGTGTQTITTNGTTVGFPINCTGIGGTRSLGSALTLGSTRQFRVDNGTLDLNGYDLTAGSFFYGGTATRTLAFGTNKIYVTATSGTVITATNVSNLTITGTPIIEVTGNGSTTRDIIGGTTGITEARTTSVKVTAGTDAITINYSFFNLEFTSGFTGSVSVTSAVTIYGDLLVPSASSFTTSGLGLTFAATSAGKQINLGGYTYDGAVTFNGVGGTWQLLGSFTMGGGATARTLQLTSGVLDLNGYTITTNGAFGSNVSTARGLNGPGTIITTLISNTAGVTVFPISAGTMTNFSVGGSGTPTIELAGNGSVGTRGITLGSSVAAAEANTINVKVSAGTDTIAITAGSTIKDLDFTGFSGTHTNTTRTIYGSLILSSGATYTAGSSAWTFAATSGTKNITSNGITHDWPVTLNGAGGTWQLLDALTLGSTRTLTLTAGTFDASLYNVSMSTFSSSGTGVRQVKFGSGTWTISGTGAGTWNCGTSTNMTTVQGTAIIDFTGASTKNAAFGGLTYPTINQGGAGALKITDGGNTFLNITNTVQPATVTFDSGTTNYFENFSLSGTLGNLITINASGAGTHTLSKASGTVSVSYCTISDSVATGGATWLASVTYGNVDGGNNSGWSFAAVASSTAYLGFFSFFN